MITAAPVKAVIECGRDENLQQGAAHQLLMTTHCHACLRKICSATSSSAAAHGARTLTSSRCCNIKLTKKRALLAIKSARSPSIYCSSSYEINSNYKTSLAKSASRDRSPRASVLCHAHWTLSLRGISYTQLNRLELMAYLQPIKYSSTLSVVHVAIPAPKKSASSVHTGQPIVMAHAKSGQSSASRMAMRCKACCCTPA